jgi:hypothetical protein
MVRLLLIVPMRSKSVTSLLIICQRWKFLRMKTTLNTQRRGAATVVSISGKRGCGKSPSVVILSEAKNPS